MTKQLECVWRTISNAEIELTDEQWDAYLSDELYYLYATRDTAFFEDHKGNKVRIPVKNYYTDYDESGREGLFCPKEGDYV